MSFSTISLDSERRGVLLIGVGLAIVALAQLAAGVPIAAAIVIIGWGTFLSTASRPHGNLLGLLNLPVYVCLGSLAIASQADAAIDQGAGQVSLILLVDHALAIVLLVGLTIHTVRRLSQATTDAR